MAASIRARPAGVSIAAVTFSRKKPTRRSGATRPTIWAFFS
jgi:hypothetical protein